MEDEVVEFFNSMLIIYTLYKYFILKQIKNKLKYFYVNKLKINLLHNHLIKSKMGAGLSQTKEGMGENIKAHIDLELEEKIKTLPPCAPEFIAYRLYLLKSHAEAKKKEIDMYNEGKHIDATPIN